MGGGPDEQKKQVAGAEGVGVAVDEDLGLGRGGGGERGEDVGGRVGGVEGLGGCGLRGRGGGGALLDVDKGGCVDVRRVPGGEGDGEHDLGDEQLGGLERGAGEAGEPVVVGGRVEEPVCRDQSEADAEHYADP